MPEAKVDKIKFGFVSWDWKGHMSSKEMRKIQEFIAEPTFTTEIQTCSDSFCIAIHTSAPGLTSDDWYDIEQCTNYADFDKEFEVTPKEEWPPVFSGTEEELRAFVGSCNA